MGVIKTHSNEVMFIKKDKLTTLTIFVQKVF